jgi:hypothetical protein
MILELAVLLIVAGIPLPLAWFLARRKSAWRKRRVILLAALPLPLLMALIGGGSILYGALIAKGTCGYDDCGGFILIGILCISAAIFAYLGGLIPALVGTIIARRDRGPGSPDLSGAFR